MTAKMHLLCYISAALVRRTLEHLLVVDLTCRSAKVQQMLLSLTGIHMSTILMDILWNFSKVGAQHVVAS